MILAHTYENKSGLEELEGGSENVGKSRWGVETNEITTSRLSGSPVRYARKREREISNIYSRAAQRRIARGVSKFEFQLEAELNDKHFGKMRSVFKRYGKRIYLTVAFKVKKSNRNKRAVR